MELGSLKKIESTNFRFKKFWKNHSCGEYYDPSLWKFSITNSLYSDLGKKSEIWQDFKILRLHIVHLDLQISLFCPKKNTTNLCLNIFRMVDHNIIYNNKCFSEFFKKNNAVFLETELDLQIATLDTGHLLYLKVQVVSVSILGG